MRLSVLVVLSVILACFSASAGAQTSSLDDLQGAVTEARARAAEARARLVQTDARQIAAQTELRTLLAQTADTSEIEKAIRELEQTQPDLAAIKERFLREGERHDDKLSKLKAELGPLQQSPLDTSKIDAEIAALKDDIRDFEDYRARALQELRQGFYCSQCSRPASQIVKETGTSFKQHLRNVNGRAIPMSESKIAQKKKQFDGQLEQLVTKLKAREDTRDRMIKERKEKIASLQKAINDEYDDYTAKQTAFDADMAEAKQTHEREKRAKIEALRDKAKAVLAAHRDSIEAKQDDLSALSDEIYEIRDEIREHELVEFKAGLKVDHAVFLERLEMRSKAREIARERERLRREAQVAFLANLRAEQLRRTRATQAARARVQVASARFREAVERSRSSWVRQNDVSRAEAPVETAPAQRAETSAPEPETAPDEPKTVSSPPVNEPVQQVQQVQPVEPAQQDIQPVREDVQPRQDRETAQVANIQADLDRLKREQEALERKEKAQRETAEKLARLEAERVEAKRAGDAFLQDQIGDIAETGATFAADADWDLDMPHPADSFETARASAEATGQSLLDEVQQGLVDLATGAGQELVGTETEASPWETFNARVSEEVDAAKTYYRKKLNKAGETLLLGLIKSKSSAFSDKVSDTVRSFEESLGIERYAISRAGDVASDAAMRLNYEARTGENFDDLSEFEQNAERVLAAGRRLSVPKTYLDRLVNRYETLMNSAERAFLEWRYDDDY